MCVFPPRSLRWRLIQGWHIKELCWAGQMHEWNLLLRCFIPRLLRPWCTRTNTQGKIKTENTISDSRFGERLFFLHFSCICQMKVLLMYMFYSLLIKLMTLALLTCSGSLVAQCYKWVTVGLIPRECSWTNVYHTKVWNNSNVIMFWKQFLLLISAAFIRSKMQQDVYNLEILLQFKITCFYFNIFQNILYSCDTKMNFQNHCFSVTWSRNLFLWWQS